MNISFYEDWIYRANTINAKRIRLENNVPLIGQ